MARNSSISLIPDVGYTDFQDSPILPVKEDTLTNCVKEDMKMNMECDSIFEYDSPDISTPLNSNLFQTEKSINSLSNISHIKSVPQPILKRDTAS